MKFALFALLGSVSAIKLDGPIDQTPANSYGDTRTAGKQVETVLKDQYRSVGPLVPPAVVMKIQRDPAFAFVGPHPHYHSTSTTGNAGQAGEFANGGTLT